MRPFTLACLAILALTGFAYAEDIQVTNPECPVMVGTPVMDDLFVEYRGVKVFLCCESCVTDFRAEPEKYLKDLPPDLVAAMIPLEQWREQGGWKQKTPKELHAYGVLHPALVHFPVALTAVAALAALLSLLVAKAFFRQAATFTIVMAAVFVFPAMLTGEEAEEGLGVKTDALHERVEAHESAGALAPWIVIGAAVLQVLAVAGPFSRAGWFRVVGVAGLLAAAGFVGWTGYLGGEVMRGPDHLKNVLPF